MRPVTTTDRILGEAESPWTSWVKAGVRPPDEYERKSAKLAFKYCQNVLKSTCPELEPVIALSPDWAYNYSVYLVGYRWPEAEKTILADNYWGSHYVHYWLNDYFEEVSLTPPDLRPPKRWKEAEEHLAYASPWVINKYVSLFPEAKWEWAVNGWIDWTDI